MSFLRTKPVRLLIAAFAAAPLLQGEITPTENTATINFPTTVDFHLEASAAGVEVTGAEVAYRIDGLSCNDAYTVADPDEFSAGEVITADWTLDMRQTGAVPPETTVFWKWALTGPGDGGTQVVYETAEEAVTLHDETHDWQQVESDRLKIYWYEGDEAFARTLEEAGESAIERLETFFGIEVTEQVRVYNYASGNDMQGATLFAPSWSGGLAFSQYNALLMAVSPDEIEWGQRAIGHELTHVISGRYAFSCVNSTPVWFEEGFAMVMEGDPDPGYVRILEDAIRDDTLLSVRALGNAMSAQPELAGLGYAESRSLVQFLIDDYGADKVRLLLDQFKQGRSIDGALEEVYGFDRDGLEVVWRASIGAQPMKESQIPEAVFTPYPTLHPIVEPPDPHAEIRPTPDYVTSADGESGLAPEAGDDSWQTIMLIALGVACAIILGLVLVAALVVWLARRSRSAAPPPGGIQ